MSSGAYHHHLTLNMSQIIIYSSPTLICFFLFPQLPSWSATQVIMWVELWKSCLASPLTLHIQSVTRDFKFHHRNTSQIWHLPSILILEPWVSHSLLMSTATEEAEIWYLSHQISSSSSSGAHKLFSVKGQTVNIFNVVSHKVAATGTQLCCTESRHSNV